jgi:transposase
MKHEALAPEDLWDTIEPFLPEKPPRPKAGQTRVRDRAAFSSIVFTTSSFRCLRLRPTA